MVQQDEVSCFGVFDRRYNISARGAIRRSRLKSFFPVIISASAKKSPRVFQTPAMPSHVGAKMRNKKDVVSEKEKERYRRSDSTPQVGEKIYTHNPQEPVHDSARDELLKGWLERQKSHLLHDGSFAG